MKPHFYWRDHLFSFTFSGVCERTDTALGAQLHQWAADFRQAMEVFFTGAVYVNSMQDGLRDWKNAYYGCNFDRLCAAKRRYDPYNMFSFPQELMQP
jgi:hypothetical protein